MTYNIGQKIRQRRIELGLSQTELAKRAGYADKTGISKIESGDRDLNSEKIALFARVLDMDPAELLPDPFQRPLRDAPLVLTDEEEDLIRKLRSLPEEGRQDVMEIVRIAFSAYVRYLTEGTDDAGI